MSFLEGVEGTHFPLLPQEILVRAEARSGLGTRATGRAPEGGGFSGPFPGLLPQEPPPPAGPFLPSPPRGTSSGSRSREQLCLQTSRGRAGVRPRPAGAGSPQAFGGVPGP